ncbi:hypothetical protein KCP69_15420 [Salmonella enterica subsp. enterica]|nr:hypothetical protein KCP69_15420 [Salmonella enterica subsp. enterica]
MNAGQPAGLSLSGSIIIVRNIISHYSLRLDAISRSRIGYPKLPVYPPDASFTRFISICAMFVALPIANTLTVFSRRGRRFFAFPSSATMQLLKGIFPSNTPAARYAVEGFRPREGYGLRRFRRPAAGSLL